MSLEIIPDSEKEQISLHPLFTLGVTERFQIGVFWQNKALQSSLINRFTVAELQAFKDQVILAVKRSLDKRLPTIVTY